MRSLSFILSTGHIISNQWVHAQKVDKAVGRAKFYPLLIVKLSLAAMLVMQGFFNLILLIT